MLVIKRDGREARFEKSKIVSAIRRAYNDAAASSPDPEAYAIPYAKSLSDRIANRLYSRYLHRNNTISVEDIQNDVETELMREGEFEIAKEYIKYRYRHELVRGQTILDGKILALTDGVNEEIIQENSNKNPTVLSTQRDYIAGEISKDITLRTLLPEDIRRAHEDGLIHFHDADYAVCKMHNCFHRKEKIITNEGVVSFGDLHDGEEVTVLDKDGVWRKATVHNYHEPKMMNIVTLTAGRTKKEIVCTSDHRWVLKNGSVTTTLQVGDRLAPLPYLQQMPKVTTKDQAKAFCIGFILGDGTDHAHENIVDVRLCGNKVRYENVFKLAGYNVTHPPALKGDAKAQKRGIFKQDFLNNRMWRFLSSEDKYFLFLGLYAADGAVDSNCFATSDDRICELVESLSAVAGYHITSKQEIIHDTPYKHDARLINYRFMKHQPSNRCWIVTDIKPYKSTTKYDTWCVEEPVTHTFTLAGGVVTGNCCLVNLEDMLQNGTVISGTLIEKPHSFSTACNIATQIIAQVASNQYGGQSISLSHLAPFVDISRQKFKKDVLKEFVELSGHEPQTDEEWIKVNEIVECRVREEIRRGVQTIQYQVVTLMTTNGQAPFITVFMYLNEVEDGRLKDDLAMIIEETVEQRYQGVKNESGSWITPAFPKLIYVLEPDNITEGSKYWYLTKLCAKCSAKRLVPDYISEKMMLENKVDKRGEGHCYPCINKACA